MSTSHPDALRGLASYFQFYNHQRCTRASLSHAGRGLSRLLMDTLALAQDSRSMVFHPPSPSHWQRSISAGLVKGRDELVCAGWEKHPPQTSP
jgi:hypothetical protein